MIRYSSKMCFIVTDKEEKALLTSGNNESMIRYL